MGKSYGRTSIQTAVCFQRASTHIISELEAHHTWKDVIDTVAFEVEEAGVSKKYSTGLAAFLSAAYIEKQPILLVGPNAIDISQAFSASIQQPLYSTLPDAEEMEIAPGCKNIRIASRTNQRIIMLNKGSNDKGFMVCKDCGAAMPGDNISVLNDINRPYKSKYARSKCRHFNSMNVNLGYDFITDMLVLEFAIDDSKIDASRNDNPWLSRAAQSLAEALRLAASKKLDVEFTELVTGYRLRTGSEASYFTDSSIPCQGLADHFHNLAVVYAKQEMNEEACHILERGIQLRDSAVDLLSDYLLYGRNLPEKRSRCKEYFQTLLKLPRSSWNWRAYSFSIDHLLEERNFASTEEQEKTIKDQSIEIAKEFIKRYSKKNADQKHLDRAFADLAGIYRAFGDLENERKVLKRCVDNYERVPLASIRLAEIEFGLGNYSAVSTFLSNCEAALDIQPSFSQGYVYLLMAHSDTSRLFNNADDMSSDERQSLVLKINKDLDTAEGLIDSIGNPEHGGAIQTLRTILEKQFPNKDGVVETSW